MTSPDSVGADDAHPERRIRSIQGFFDSRFRTSAQRPPAFKSALRFEWVLSAGFMVFTFGND
jgi:hypothetical protein